MKKKCENIGVSISIGQLLKLKISPYQVKTTSEKFTSRSHSKEEQALQKRNQNNHSLSALYTSLQQVKAPQCLTHSESLSSVVIPGLQVVLLAKPY